MTGEASKFSGHLWELVQWRSGRTYISWVHVHVPMWLCTCVHAHISHGCSCVSVCDTKVLRLVAFMCMCMHMHACGKVLVLFHCHADLWSSTSRFPGCHKSQSTNCIRGRRACTFVNKIATGSMYCAVIQWSSLSICDQSLSTQWRFFFFSSSGQLKSKKSSNEINYLTLFR